MQNIDADSFIRWTEEHFDNVKVHGNEVKINDIWWKDEFDNKDEKNHCWVNTDKCCFRAFKSGKTGHLIELVMEIEGCDWDEAVEILGGEDSLKSLHIKLDKFFENEKTDLKPKKTDSRLPSDTCLISDLLPKNPLRIKAENYLTKRKISVNGLMISANNKYFNRIIIPYWDKNKNLIYFNSRALDDDNPERYKGPPKETFGSGKGDVLWIKNWSAKKLYLTEGEFDAMSLIACGLDAGACGGKNLCDKQIELLRDFEKIVIAFDNDKAGREGLKIASVLYSHGIKSGFIRPPQGFKDWNMLLISHGENIVLDYIKNNEKDFTEDSLIKLEFGL